MIIHEFEQGSPEWFRCRCGIPSASRFDQIVTPKTLKPSASAFGYMCELLAEQMLDEPYGGDGTETGYIRRGRGMEQEAMKWYEFQAGISIRRVGFCIRDDGLAGCSPDGLIGDDGGIEVKCPGARKHVQYMIQPQTLAAEYRHQVQGALYVTQRTYWILLSYNPAMMPVVQRIEPEADYQAALDKGIRQLNADIRSHLIQFGYVEADAA